jgi:hypothetical protein
VNPSWEERQRRRWVEVPSTGPEAATTTGEGIPKTLVANGFGIELDKSRLEVKMVRLL